MYEGNDRTRQVEAVKTLASDIGAGYLVDPADFGGDAEAAASEAVGYYLEEGNHSMPEWFDNHDRGLLVRFVTEALQ